MPSDAPLTSPFRSFGRNSLVDAFYGFPPGRKRTIPEVVADTSNGTTGAASVSATKPTRVHAGSLMIAFFASRNSTPTTPTGWTNIGYTLGSADTTPGFSAYYRVADTTDDAVTTYSFASSNAQNKYVGLIVVEGADPVEPFYAWNFDYKTGGNSVFPRCGILDRDCLVIAMVCSSSGANTSTPIHTFGTPFTKRLSEINVGSNRQSGSYATYIPSEISGFYDDYIPLTYPSTLSTTNGGGEAVWTLVVQGEMVAGTN